MDNPGDSKKLRIADLHPALQLYFEIGAEVLHSLACAIRKEGDEKTALELTDADEENTGKTIGYNQYTYRGIKFKVPIYASEHRWRVNFCVECNGKLGTTTSLVLEGVVDEASGIRELEAIAGDLQRVYRLPYTPGIYRNGQPVETESVPKE